MLTAIMLVNFIPSVSAADDDATEGGGTTGSEVTPPTGGKVEDFELSYGGWTQEPSGDDYYLLLEPDSDADKGAARIEALLKPADDEEVQKLHVAWSTTSPTIVGVSEQNEGHVGNVYGRTPGKAEVTVSVNTEADQKVDPKTIYVTVSGIQIGEELAKGITVNEREMKTITKGTDYYLFGNADSSGAQFTYEVVNDKKNVYLDPQPDGLVIEGREAGSATVRITCHAGGRTYMAEFPVTVVSNEAVIEYTEGCSVSNPLKFSILESLIEKEFKSSYSGGTMTSVIGLSVPTAQGTIYLGYKSPEDTGAGAGSSITYYVRTAARGPYIQDLTFVPNASFSGEKASIAFTAQGTDAKGGIRTLTGRIEVTLTEEKTDLALTTSRDTPLKLTAAPFSKVCQEQVGSPLDYIVFTLPPASEGTLYVDYKSEWDYASKVSSSQQYKRSQLEKITFVPAQGYIGTVTVGYAGYSVSGSKYNGQLVIQVKQGQDDAITYNGTGEVNFSRSEFDEFSENATGRVTASVSFTQLPSSQGKLYYNWNGTRGTEVQAGNTYTAAQIDRLTFVAADGFNGVVRIPFSGTDKAGETFNGTVEIHIKTDDRSNGDINYVCAPGESVKLVLSDFANLCQSLTGQRLHYISFQSLPDFNQGTLYHNRTSGGSMGNRVTTATKYFNSATPYIMNLSFWATEQFRSVEIPFTGAAVTGETFTGILAISSGAGAGSGAAGTVYYSTMGQSPVQFSGADFDAACREATNAALGYLRLELPVSGQGILYYDYRAGSTPKAFDSSVTLYRSGGVSIDKVTFMPAKGFTGVAAVPFTGWAIDGREFRGTVQIAVQTTTALGGLVRYETQGEPVHISAYDIQAAAGGEPASLRLTGLPPASQGKVYYQYQGPTQYSWMGNTSTVYTLYGDPSVSNLTFVPKAGFYGTVEIPYAATNTNGTQSDGTIRITVSEPHGSGAFNDMGGYPVQTQSAVEYLSALGVVLGTGNGKYEPGASIRRGDFCVMLARAFPFDVGSTVQGFSDVPATAYYAQAVNQMYALGVVNGVGGGRFDPSAPVSRQDASLMVQRTLNQAGINAPDGNAAALAAYNDRAQVAGYAQGAVGGLAQLGIYPVASDGKLVPKANLTRADMALLLHRAMTQS